jgi:dolichol-phosphate mannosyltransferase
MEQQSLVFEAIVVNDGSVDDTLCVARSQAALMPLTIVDHGRNRGLGEAMKSGLLKASALAGLQDVIVMMDADNTHSPKLVGSMVNKIGEGYDLVVASRFVDGGKQVGLRMHRRILSRSASMLLSVLFPISGINDYSCGYRAYSSAIIRKSLETYGTSFIEEQGFTCLLDLLLKLRRLGIRSCQVPLVLRYDHKLSASKMRIMQTILRYLRLIMINLTVRETRPFQQIRLANL